MSRQPEVQAPTRVTSVVRTATKITLRIETGKAVFSPVSYNSFEVGSVSVELELPSGTDVAAALAEMDALAREYFKGAYAYKLESYLKALRYNAKKVAESKAQD